MLLSSHRQQTLASLILLFSFFHVQNAAKECGIYLAPSTIPGAGLGMFAGNKQFEKGDLVSFGDQVIPVVELDWHNGHRPYDFLWTEYVWHYNMFPGMEQEVDDGEDIHAVSGGMGAAVNCMLPLVNVEDHPDYSQIDNAGVTSDSPGIGAFTPYNGRKFVATTNIEPGAELYASYGDSYFETRPSSYGYIPLSEDYTKADELLWKYRKTIYNLVKTQTQSGEEHTIPNLADITQDLWKLIRTQPDIWMESRVLNALPKNHTQVNALLNEGGTSRQHYNASIRSLEWLEEYGQCMDNIRDGISNIRDAGRGAFATRRISKGSLVAPAPLVHIPDRNILAMYDALPVHPIDGVLYRNESALVHQQLLLNYCFGHEESTLLLCPYGLLTALINHSHDEPNTKIVWTKTMRSPEWMDSPISNFGSLHRSGLSFDFVAIRDINEGEEILIDYGEAWEKAWNNHVSMFKTPRPHYVPAFELNAIVDLKIRTMHERSYELDDVLMYCYNDYLELRGAVQLLWDIYNAHSAYDNEGQSCRVVRRYDESNTYDVEIMSYMNQDGQCFEIVEGIMFDMPRDAIFFRDIAYARDHLQYWSFRHEMMIPDAIFPESWKNLKQY